jgi:hypothetical protein
MTEGLKLFGTVEPNAPTRVADDASSNPFEFRLAAADFALLDDGGKAHGDVLREHNLSVTSGYRL